jgi:acyl-CoA synthetase (AMP-forming)/AMP-acid ligase II
LSADSPALHPLSAFLAPWLAGGTPGLSRLTAMARERRLVTGGGVALRFVEPSGGPEGYEEHAFTTGEIATRPCNRHDFFNALIWLAFPHSKAALNRRHHAALVAARRAGCTERGELRDALTQFDECGVVIAGCAPEIWQGLCEHRWREVFVERREELLRSTRFMVFGHASHDALAAPFVGLCGKALFLEVDATWLELPVTAALASLDLRLAALFDERDFSPRDWQPLPLLGIPGATAESEQPDYYDDTRQFRPPRTMRAGSSPGNR